MTNVIQVIKVSDTIVYSSSVVDVFRGLNDVVDEWLELAWPVDEVDRNQASEAITSHVPSRCGSKDRRSWWPLPAQLLSTTRIFLKKCWKKRSFLAIFTQSARIHLILLEIL